MTRRASLAVARVVSVAALAVGCAGPPARDGPPLLGDAAERVVAPGETALYRLPLAAGQLVRIELEQHGIDVFARLRDPAGRLVVEADRMINDDGPELVATVVQTAGEHLLELAAGSRPGAPGKVAIRVETRPASEADRRWAELYGAFLAAEARARDGEREAALDGYEQVIAGAVELGDGALAAEARVRRGEALVTLGRWSDGRDAFAELVAAAPADGLWRMLALEFLGATRLALGETEAAVEPLEAALALAEGCGHRFRRAQAHLNLGKARRQRGEVQRALDHLRQARALLRPSELAPRALVSHDLGVLLHWNLGQPQAALAAFEEARGLYRQLGDGGRPYLATTLNQMAAAHEALGEPARAAERYGEALELRRALGQRCAEANTLVRLALTTPADDAARALADEARAIVGAEPCPRDHPAVRLRLGSFEERLGRLAAARAEYERALELYLARGDRAGEVLALLGTARLRRRAGDDDAGSLALARRALALVEETRGELKLEGDRVAYGSHIHRLFDLLIDLEQSLGLARDAFASAELARARALRDRLRQVGAGVEPQLAEPISLAGLRARLDAGTVLLEYRLGEARSFLWAVGSDFEASFELPPRAAIEAEAARARALLSSPEPLPGGDGWRAEPFRELAAQVLPAELAPRLAGRRLLVVADGVLELVPFAALPGVDGRPLVAAHDVVHVPSASVWAALRDRPAPPPPAGFLAVVADPVYDPDDDRLDAPLPRAAAPPALARLAGSEREAAAILAAAPTTATRALLGFDATRGAVLGGALGGYRYLHFATHAVIDPRQPARSYLALSRLDRRGAEQDGDLFAHELYGLDLDAELVVVAGCETGLGTRIPGEGLVSGLARGFLEAGARRVVVSLWPVSDRATPELMTRFYRRLFATGDPVRSLRLVQGELYREGRHPYEWAGFVIQGE